MPGSVPLPIRVARLFVDAASRRVPDNGRDQFLREWHGEIDAEERTGAAWRVVRTALGAFADANAVRAIANGDEERFTMRAMLSGLTHDVAVSLRSLRHSAGFAVVAILMIGLGIGGSAAMFTVIKRVVLDPLPYPEAARMVRISNRVPGVGTNQVWSLSSAQYFYFKDHATTLARIGLYRSTGGNVTTKSGPQRIRGVNITASSVPLFGIRAALGRAIDENDDTPAATPVAMLSRGFWTRVFGADPSVVGTTLSFNDKPVTIIGVLRDDVELPGLPGTPNNFNATPDLWFPLRLNPAGPFYNNHAYPAVALLAPGATAQSVESEIAGLTPRLPEAFPQAYSKSFFDRYGFRTQAVPLKDDVLGTLSRNLWVLFGGVGLVLLIACANVANLFAVRIDGRKRELAIRSALGAGRVTLARHVLAESLTLALLGALLAIAVSVWAIPALTALAPADLPRIHGVHVTTSTVVFSLVVALVVGLGLALYPIAVHAGPRAIRSLGDSTRSTTAGRERNRMRGALIVSQVALALTLAIGAGLMIATLVTLRAVDVGMSPRGVLTAEVFLSPTRYPSDEAVWRFYREMLARVRALPGVTAAGMSEELPVSSGFGCTVQGFDEPIVFDRIKQAGMTTCAGQEPTTPGYFETLGIPILQGRAFVDADNDDPSRAAVVVSKAFADRFWPGENAIGKGVAPNGRTTGPFHHVVGVAGNIPRAVDEGGIPLSEPGIAVYYPMRHDPQATWNAGWWAGYMSLVVKTGLEDPVAQFPSIRRVISEVDPDVPLANVTTMDAIIGQATSQLAFISILLSIATGVALLLAAVGLYGTISYVVSRRTREIGMRLAIGAQPGQVQLTVIRRSLTLAAIGITLGVGLAALATRSMRAIIVGVQPTDVRVYGLAVALLVAIALVASWLPARRASRIDPVEALRMD